MSITLPTWPAGALQPEDPFNQAMQTLGAIVNAAAETTTNTPPTTVLADKGKIWIIGTAGTGLWAGRNNQIALCTAANVWEFYAPQVAWLVWDKAANQMKRWDGSVWVVFTSTSGSTSKGHIDGLKLLWVSGTAITVTSGEAYVEGQNGVVAAAASIAKSSLSLSNSTWYHVYLFLNGASADVEIVTTAPDTAYSGTARSKTGDNSRRYIGSIRTNGSGAVYKFAMVGCRITYLLDVTATPFRVLSNGTSTSWASVSFASVVPITSNQAYAISQNIDAAISCNVSSGASGADFLYVVNPKQVIPAELPLGASQTFNYQMLGATATGLYIDVLAYTFER